MLSVADGAANVVMGLADFLIGFFDPSPPAPMSREQRSLAERKSERALDSMKRSLDQGEPFRDHDIEGLTREVVMDIQKFRRSLYARPPRQARPREAALSGQRTGTVEGLRQRQRGDPSGTGAEEFSGEDIRKELHTALDELFRDARRRIASISKTVRGGDRRTLIREFWAEMRPARRSKLIAFRRAQQALRQMTILARSPLREHPCSLPGRADRYCSSAIHSACGDTAAHWLSR